MKPSVLDTDVFSEVLKNRDAQVSGAAKRYRAEFGRLTVSAITVMEIVKGLHKVQRTERVTAFLRYLSFEEVLLFDVPAAELTGRIYADLERTGQPIGRADPMIAGIALQRDLVLVTANIEHFRRIADLGYPLRLENWREVPSG